MKVQMTLRNGVQLDFEAEEITRTMSPITNEMTGLDWTNIDDPDTPCLFFIRVDEIAAIVTRPQSQEESQPA